MLSGDSGQNLLTNGAPSVTSDSEQQLALIPNQPYQLNQNDGQLLRFDQSNESNKNPNKRKRDNNNDNDHVLATSTELTNHLSTHSTTGLYADSNTPLPTSNTNNTEKCSYVQTVVKNSDNTEDKNKNDKTTENVKTNYSNAGKKSNNKLNNKPEIVRSVVNGQTKIQFGQKRHTNDDGFTLVGNRRGRNQRNKVMGSAFSEVKSLRAVTKPYDYYVGQWSMRTTPDILKQYINKFAKVIGIVELSTHVERRYFRAYKVSVESFCAEAMLTSSNWPGGIEVCRWYKHWLSEEEAYIIQEIDTSSHNIIFQSEFSLTEKRKGRPFGGKLWLVKDHIKIISSYDLS
ncbi:hypothetical protein BpHYR1_033930, partial [Brachionus plicatilis]